MFAGIGRGLHARLPDVHGVPGVVVPARNCTSMQRTRRNVLYPCRGTAVPKFQPTAPVTRGPFCVPSPSRRGYVKPDLTAGQARASNGPHPLRAISLHADRHPEPQLLVGEGGLRGRGGEPNSHRPKEIRCTAPSSPVKTSNAGSVRSRTTSG
ncbi:hypothetical protein SEA_BIPPER_124 [Mycobacterium phage Bipper]|uniref:Uncharacterized protein n=1 Tax=Mycobacterium phage Bipper TaxID=1805457 RepID=A0A142F2Q2_9CAUD|nr:hypothetical protein KCH39_gp053 [Mycobacterium phage Bipper]AMQ67059.1 hypothetical protein SEA_BIPPER_124 [Mycobacterium phage Bipper]